MPTSLEALLRYRAAHANCCESRRVWLFHSHTYFDHATPERVAEARAFMNLIERTFAATAHLPMSSFIPAPAGPHPRGSFEVLFTREVFADYVSWLMFSRPEGLNILIHPLTRSQTLDHTQRALWLGTQIAIDVPMLDAVRANTGERPAVVLADAGYRSEENLKALRRRRQRSLVALGREGKRGPKWPKGPLTQRMHRILRLPWARELYAHRKTQGERPFAEIKQRMKYRGFSLRGAPKVRGEWDLVCAALNLVTIWRAAEA